MIEELVAKVFATRNNVHLAHWKETSGFRHVALGDFYERVIEDVDTLVEVYQGCFGKIGNVAGSFQTPADIVELLSNDADWIANNRKDISKGLGVIESLIDVLLATYLQTIYKLDNLS